MWKVDGKTGERHTVNSGTGTVDGGAISCWPDISCMGTCPWPHVPGFGMLHSSVSLAKALRRKVLIIN